MNDADDLGDDDCEDDDVVLGKLGPGAQLSAPKKWRVGPRSPICLEPMMLMIVTGISTHEVAVKTLTMFKIGLEGRGFRDMMIPYHAADDYVSCLYH